jgi:hypothetical protein
MRNDVHWQAKRARMLTMSVLGPPKMPEVDEGNRSSSRNRIAVRLRAHEAGTKKQSQG